MELSLSVVAAATVVAFWYMVFVGSGVGVTDFIPKLNLAKILS